MKSSDNGYSSLFLKSVGYRRRRFYRAAHDNTLTSRWLSPLLYSTDRRLKKECQNNLSNKKIDTSLLELVHADLNQGAGWQEAVHRCNFVIHIAAPYPTVDPTDENELIIPARDGTLRVLHAAQAADVQRVIFLSTIGAIYDGHQGENRKFDETDWSDLSKILSTNHKR